MATVEVAAARGASLLLGMHAAPAENRGMIEHHAAVAARHGHRPDTAEHATAHLAFVADTDADARAALHRSLPAWLAATAGYVRIDGSAGPRRDPEHYAQQLLDRHPVGTPDLCVQRLEKAAATSGARRLMLMVEAAGDPDRTLDNIHRLGTQVLPRLRR